MQLDISRQAPLLVRQPLEVIPSLVLDDTCLIFSLKPLLQVAIRLLAPVDMFQLRRPLSPQ